MKLLTKEIERKLPKLYSTDGQRGERPVVCKFFDPSGSATWYILEGERNEGGDLIMFGLVTGLCEDELGYVSLNELQAVRGRFGLGIERDLYFGRQTLREAAPEFCARLWPEEKTA